MKAPASLFLVGIIVGVVCASFEHAACANESDQPSEPDQLEHPEKPFPIVVFEAPYKLGTRYVLKSPADAKAEADAIALWNSGGRASAWHPQPRVIVDNVRVQGAISSVAVLRTARAQGYWPIRRCYDPALPDQPTLRGKASVRVTIDTSGKATRSTIMGKPTLDDQQVVACIRDGMRGIAYPRTTRGTADVTMDITLSPGDALMKRVEDPPVDAGPGTVSLPIVQAWVARHAGAVIQHCYAEAVQRIPGLWGRLVLRLDVAANGAIREIVEIESTFPDPLTTQCSIDAIRRIGLPPPENGPLRIVFPIRFGELPSDARLPSS